MNHWERQRAAMDLEREWREGLGAGDAVVVHVNGYCGRSTQEQRVQRRTPRRVIVDGRTFALDTGSKIGPTSNGATVEIWQPGGARLALFHEQLAKEAAEAQEKEECGALRRRIEGHLRGLGLDELRAVAVAHGLEVE